jgi:hypothetical protein
MSIDSRPKCAQSGCRSRGVCWIECGNCVGGFGEHDCGEDTCCCVNPRDNVPCSICCGAGGWLLCFDHAGEADDLEMIEY